jgi:hypothetical protein
MAIDSGNVQLAFPPELYNFTRSGITVRNLNAARKGKRGELSDRRPWALL